MNVQPAWTKNMKKDAEIVASYLTEYSDSKFKRIYSKLDAYVENK